MKKKTAIIWILCLLMLLPIGKAGTLQAEAAVTRPGTVTGLGTTRIKGTTLRLTWNKATKASGYDVYMKTNSGYYKKVRRTTSLSYKRTGLTLGATYYFKVRAYRKVNGKTYYGVLSSPIKRKLTTFEYMTRVLSPYYNEYYNSYTGADTIKMADNYYHNAFVLGNYTDKGRAFFNLKGRYKTLTFTIGETDIDEGNTRVAIYGDDELIKTITVKAYGLPRKYTVNVQNIYKLEVYKSGSWTDIGFGNVRLYY